MDGGVDVPVQIMDESVTQQQFDADLRKIVGLLDVQPDPSCSVMSFCLTTGECYPLSSIIEALLARIAATFPGDPYVIPGPDVAHLYTTKGAG